MSESVQCIKFQAQLFHVRGSSKGMYTALVCATRTRSSLGVAGQQVLDIEDAAAPLAATRFFKLTQVRPATHKNSCRW